MPAESERSNVLPKELMAEQLGQIDLLLAMYAPDDAILIEPAALETVEALKEWCESEADAIPRRSEANVNLLLSLDLEDSTDSPASTVQLSLSVPLTYQSERPMEPPPIKSRLQQPAWMRKAQVASINSSLPEQDVLTVIEHIKEAASKHAAQPDSSSTETPKLFDANAPLVRAWFYFPSISTREKRDDLVQYAPVYGLTGFLLAGKPGILCLEGGSAAIDNFMKFIKTDSWGDIPSQHKKVSERHRESGLDTQRTFRDMQEITETVGERRGERANRSDMKALEAWLAERGLGETLGKVLM